MEPTHPLLPITYAGPIWYYAILAQNKEVIIETKEHFVKQSFRNRCNIDGANGPLSLTIPLERKSREKTLVSDVAIIYDTPWQSLHWKSLQSTYHHSPFFEFYEEYFQPIFLKEYTTLFEFNLDLIKQFIKLLQIDCKILFSKSFEHDYTIDYRPVFSTKNKAVPKFDRYIQVFQDRHDFVNNLSVFDLLFNLGPEGLIYLKNAPLKPNL